jgi:hypothetical protein
MVVIALSKADQGSRAPWKVYEPPALASPNPKPPVLRRGAVGPRCSNLHRKSIALSVSFKSQRP